MAAKKKTASKAAKATGTRAARASKSTRSESLSLASFSPGLTVNDVETSLSWYQDVLGFKLRERWEHDGKLLGASIAAGKVEFMLGQDDWKKGRNRSKGQGIRFYCITGQDVDALAKKIKARGVKLTQEPKDQVWGYRDIALEDPDGYKITVARALKKKKKR